jgi:hypothetical protein
MIKSNADMVCNAICLGYARRRKKEREGGEEEFTTSRV